MKSIRPLDTESRAVESFCWSCSQICARVGKKLVLLRPILINLLFLPFIYCFCFVYFLRRRLNNVLRYRRLRGFEQRSNKVRFLFSFHSFCGLVSVTSKSPLLFIYYPEYLALIVIPIVIVMEIMKIIFDPGVFAFQNLRDFPI